MLSILRGVNTHYRDVIPPWLWVLRNWDPIHLILNRVVRYCYGNTPLGRYPTVRFVICTTESVIYTKIRGAKIGVRKCGGAAFKTMTFQCVKLKSRKRKKKIIMRIEIAYYYFKTAEGNSFYSAK